jgi:nucleotide-binding universal stress UspA family protein
MFERVLVPLDGSKKGERALAAAAALVRQEAGTLILLHALTGAAVFLGRERAKAARYLSGLGARLRRSRIPVKKRLVNGEASRQIVRAAVGERVDLIAMSGRGHGGGGSGPLGSVAERVVRTSPVPVLLLRHAAKIRRVVVPLDGRAQSPGIMAEVAEMARLLDAPVTILDVGPGKGRQVERAIDVLARLGISYHLHVRRDRGAAAIERLAHERGNDLVAIIAAPLDRSLHLGSAAEKLLRRTENPLLVVRAKCKEVQTCGA